MAFSDTDAAFDVCAVGNAIMDVVASCGDEFLDRHAIAKGGMTLIDAPRAQELYACAGTKVETAGGSAANTLFGIASLGGRPAYIGKTAEDALGLSFRDSLQDCGVHFSTPPLRNGLSTGQCLIFVTPDAQRSMSTFLGACVELAPEDVAPDLVRAAQITYLEGYLFDKPKAKAAFRHAARLAHEAGRAVALTLSDGFCVERYREEFLSLVREDVDILIGNEQEVTSLYQMADLDAALVQASEQCRIAVGTRGEAGAVIASEGQILAIPAEKTDPVVDTTGAGDLFASGFLFGLTHGADLESSGRLGVVTASAVLGQYGPRPKDDLKVYARDRGVSL